MEIPSSVPRVQYYLFPNAKSFLMRIGNAHYFFKWCSGYLENQALRDT